MCSDKLAFGLAIIDVGDTQDTRAMLVWVSHLLGFSLAGLLAAFFDAGSVIYDGASSGGDFVHRFWNLM